MATWQDYPQVPANNALVPYIPAPAPTNTLSAGQLSKSAYQALTQTVSNVAHFFHREPGTVLEKINRLSQQILALQQELIFDKAGCDEFHKKTLRAYSEALNCNQQAFGKLSLLFNLIHKLKNDLSNDLALEKIIGYNTSPYPSYPVEVPDSLHAIQELAEKMPTQMPPRLMLEQTNALLAVLYPLFKKVVFLKMQALRDIYNDAGNPDAANLFVENGLEASFYMREQMASDLQQELLALNQTVREFTGKTIAEPAQNSMLTHIWNKTSGKTQIPPGYFGQILLAYEEEAEKARNAKKAFLDAQVAELKGHEAYRNKCLKVQELHNQKSALEQALMNPSAPPV